MDPLLIELLKDSPWIALTVFLLLRIFRREEATLSAYKDGAESQQSLSAAIESLERSIGSVQSSVVDLRAEVRAWRAGS